MYGEYVKWRFSRSKYVLLNDATKYLFDINVYFYIQLSLFQLYVRDTVIRDFPRFKHRGVLIDSARHFMRKQVIFDVLVSILLPFKT